MATDITTAESAFSRGKTRFDTWQAQFEERWNRPVIAGQIATLLASIPDDVREQLPQRAIEALDEKILQGGKHASKVQSQQRGPAVRSQVPGQPLRSEFETYNGEVPG